MLGTTNLRVLTPEEMPLVRSLTALDPAANVFLQHRLDVTGMRPRWMGGRMWGWFEGERIVSACYVASNVVPLNANPEAVAAFAEHALPPAPRAASIVGPRETVMDLWTRMTPLWGPARSVRDEQPFLVIDHDGLVAPDPRVRRVLLDEVDVLYPASVAMFTEEVGVDPEVMSGSAYRARVTQLVGQGWSFAIIEDDTVLFKAEVGAAAGDVCQVQGVYVHPDVRGQGLAAPAMAAVVQQVRRTIAPVVTLYVNGHNVPARRTYDRVGFRQHTTFATILL